MPTMPTTPFDDRIRSTRSEFAKHKRAIECARTQRSRWLAEGEEFMEQAQARGGFDLKEKDKLERLRSKYAAAIKDYLHADQLRLQAGARLTALETVRERYLIQVHGIFPQRSGAVGA